MNRFPYTRRRPILLLAALAALVVVFVLAGCGPPPDKESKGSFRVPVTVADVGKGRVEKVLTATGTLRAVREAHLVTSVGGYLEVSRKGDARLREGDDVTQGQLVAVLWSEESRVNQTRGREAKQLDLKAQQAEYERAKSLHAKGILSDSDLAAAETRMAQARYAYESTVVAEDKNRLTAPMTGRIVELTKAVDGAYVSPGTEIASIMDYSGVVAELRMSAGDFGKIQKGMKARIINYALNEQVFEGTVDYIGPALDSATRSFRADVLIKNDGGLLRPGMFVKAEIVTDAKEGVVTVLRDLVVIRNNKPVVFVVEQQKAKSRDIVLGLEGKDTAEVLSGLSEGDRIVTRGFETLEDGTPVKVGG